jgi:hypothetical protein
VITGFERQADAAPDQGSRQRLRPNDLPERIDLIKGADIPEWNARSSALRYVGPLGNAEDLAWVDAVGVLQHRLVGGEDRHVGVGITVDLSGHLGQAVAGLDCVEAGLRLKRVALGQVGGCGDSDLNCVQLETCDSDSVLRPAGGAGRLALRVSNWTQFSGTN